MDKNLRIDFLLLCIIKACTDGVKEQNESKIAIIFAKSVKSLNSYPFEILITPLRIRVNRIIIQYIITPIVIPLYLQRSKLPWRENTRRRWRGGQARPT